MGAWNSSLVGNDSVQDEFYQFETSKNPELYLQILMKQALKESKEAYSFHDYNPEVETDHRTLFLGVLDQAFTKSEFQRHIQPTFLEEGMKMLKQLAHKEHLQGWREPDERFTELHEAYNRFKKALTESKLLS